MRKHKARLRPRPRKVQPTKALLVLSERRRRFHEFSSWWSSKSRRAFVAGVEECDYTGYATYSHCIIVPYPIESGRIVTDVYFEVESEDAAILYDHVQELLREKCQALSSITTGI